MAEKIDYEIAIYQLIPKSSGFIKEGTAGTANPEEIKFPKNRRIQNKSVRYVKDAEGITQAEKIRYLNGVNIIEEETQKAKNYLPNPHDDVIDFKNGLFSVSNFGSTVGLFKFMREHAANGSNPNRPADDRFEVIFTELKPSEEATKSSDHDFLIAETLIYLKNLRVEKGGEYIYQEDRIGLLATEFGVHGDSAAIKLTALVEIAKMNPLKFLDIAKKSEQVALIEVNHALDLKVISFDGNTAMYVDKNEKIKSFTGNLSDDKKRVQLANWFKTVDGEEAYKVFKVELEAARDAKISKQ